MPSHSKSYVLHPKYRSDIDGLRAIAVSVVIGYHAFPSIMPGGFIGVDIFFVISGFLISSIIFGDIEKNNFSYTDFYARRIRRIFPALLLVLLVSLSFGWYVLFVDEFSQLGTQVAAGVGFLANILFWSQSGYFDSAAETKPLLHLWSLGVEEQFYIFWPLVLGFVWRRKLSFFLTMTIIAVLSFSINIYWISKDPSAAFFLPFGRMWELMAGGMLAYLGKYRPQYFLANPLARSFASLVGLTLLLVSVTLLSNGSLFPGWLALFPVCGTLLVIANGASWVNSRLIGNPLLVYLGLISYPLYLWHWPLLSFAQIIENGTPDRLIRVVAVLLGVLLAVFTFHFIEKPFRGNYEKRRIVLVSLAMLVIFALGIVVMKGLVSPRQNSELIQKISLAKNERNNFDLFDNAYVSGLNNGSKLYSKTAGPLTTLFLGDSHMAQYAPRVLKVLHDYPQANSAVFAVGGDCLAIPNVYINYRPECADLIGTVRAYLEQNESVDTIVFGGYWSHYFNGRITKNEAEIYFDGSYYYLDGDGIKHSFMYSDGIELAIAEMEVFLKSLAETKKVFLLLDNPSGPNFSPGSLLRGSRFSTITSSIQVEREYFRDEPIEPKRMNERLRKIANRIGVTVIDPFKTLCSQQRCKITNKFSEPIYYDNDHLRPYFVRKHANYIDVVMGDIGSTLK